MAAEPSTRNQSSAESVTKAVARPDTAIPTTVFCINKRRSSHGSGSKIEKEFDKDEPVQLITGL
jgi:hypothetical protein